MKSHHPSSWSLCQPRIITVCVQSLAAHIKIFNLRVLEKTGDP